MTTTPIPPPPPRPPLIGSAPTRRTAVGLSPPGTRTPARTVLSPRRGARFAGALGLLFSALLLPGCGTETSAQAPVEAPPPAVGVTSPVQRPVAEWEEYTGRLAAVDTVEVRPRVTGFVDQVHFEEGALVEEGDLLVTLDPRTFRAEVARLRARRDEAKVGLELGRSEAARVESLVGSRAVSTEEVDEKRHAVESAQAAVAGAEADLQAAELNLEFTRVLAPVSGRIGRARVTRGNLVSGGSGDSTVLTTIVSVDPIRLYFSPGERAARRLLQRGLGDSEAEALVQMQLQGETGFSRRGVLDFLDNRVDEQTGTLLARAVFENPGGQLLPGMFARVRLRLGAPRPALLVPPSALILDQTREILYVVGDDDVVERRLVETGSEIDGLLVVSSGLEPGDRVVVEGLQSVRPGARVSPEPLAAAHDEAPEAPESPAPEADAGTSEDGSET